MTETRRDRLQLKYRSFGRDLKKNHSKGKINDNIHADVTLGIQSFCGSFLLRFYSLCLHIVITPLFYCVSPGISVCDDHFPRVCVYAKRLEVLLAYVLEV